MGKYIKVRKRQNSIGRWCMYKDCTTSATVTAVYISAAKYRTNVYYCLEHAKEGGII